MKAKPVRLSDISREVRIPSSSLISFLHENGYSVKGDFRSPLTCRMVELIQNGFREGPPFKELDPHVIRAEAWEKDNSELVSELHTPPPKPEPEKPAPVDKPRRRRITKPKLTLRSPVQANINSGSIRVTHIDLDIIERIFNLDEADKIKVRDFLVRKTLLKAIAKLE